jgi:signal transduction histidine kinase
MLSLSTVSDRDDEPMPALQAHPSILVRLLDELGAAVSVSPETTAWLLRDPALAARALDAQPAELRPDAVTAARLKSWLVPAAIETLYQPPAPAALQHWTDSITCACLCQALAHRLGYPDGHEAYLAGLFHNLDRLSAHPQGTPDFRRIAQWLAGWRQAPYLSGAILAQTEEPHRLAEALPLARLLRVARAAVSGDGDAHRLAAVLLPELSADELNGLQREADATVAQLKQALAGSDVPNPVPPPPQERLATALKQYFLLEQMQDELADADGEDRVLDAAQAMLARLFRVEAPLYLVHDGRNNELIPHPADSRAHPGLRIRLPGSNTAAAWAWNSREPVVFSTRDAESVSLLDIQLAALTQRDAVLAIPVDDNGMAGILLGCVDLAQIPRLERSIDFLGRVGRLIGQALARARDRQSDSTADGLAEYRDRTHRAAHEINNPLGIAKNYLAILGAKLGEGSPVAEELAIIRQELNRIPRILHSLTEDKNGSLPSEEICDVNAVIRDLGVVAESAVPPEKHIRVALRLAANSPVLHTDTGKLRQLLLNLVLNALEAAPAENGEVDIAAYTTVDHRGKKQWVIEVGDNGRGIPPEKMARLFEAQASSKQGQHAGLGLAIVKTLADELGMTVSCRSDGQGTHFQISAAAT